MWQIIEISLNNLGWAMIKICDIESKQIIINKSLNNLEWVSNEWKYSDNVINCQNHRN